MKSLVLKPGLFLSMAFMIILSCDKPEIEPFSQQDNLKAAKVSGKPEKQPPYILAPDPEQLQVYGVWHAGNDYCTWGTERDMMEFDLNNNWLIDRGGNEGPSVNLVVMSFVNPLKLLRQTTDATTLVGIPRGMTQEVSLTISKMQTYG
jgi:hypothetical protein